MQQWIKILLKAIGEGVILSSLLVTHAIITFFTGVTNVVASLPLKEAEQAVANEDEWGQLPTHTKRIRSPCLLVRRPTRAENCCNKSTQQNSLQNHSCGWHWGC